MRTELGPREVCGRLGFDEGSDAALWVEDLERLGPLPARFAVALDRPLAERGLALIGTTEEESSDVLATLPSPESTPEWWWCLEREVFRLVAHMGDIDAPRGLWPDFEGPEYPLDYRCHFLHVALAVIPHTLTWYAAVGVPDEVAVGALAELRRHMAVHRRVHGLTGIDAAWWMTLCLRAEILDLGRLQYHRFRFGRSEESPLWYPRERQLELGVGFRDGDDCLGIHIPEGSPLTPRSVADSLERAAEFFPRYFPSETRRIATCMSWMLDDQLAGYLGEDSNIVSFQRLFELVPGWYEGDNEVRNFVFRVGPLVPIDSLPQRSTLERAAVAHWRAGKHFRMRTGWLRLAS